MDDFRQGPKINILSKRSEVILSKSPRKLLHELPGFSYQFETMPHKFLPLSHEFGTFSHGLRLLLHKRGSFPHQIKPSPHTRDELPHWPHSSTQNTYY